MTERMFPIQAQDKLPASSIPWWLAEEAYAQYSHHYGTGQTLERLAERGGFGRIEFLDLLAGGDGTGVTLTRVRGRRRR